MNPKKKVTSVSEKTAYEYRKAKAKFDAHTIMAKEAIKYWESGCCNGAEHVEKAFLSLKMYEHELNMVCRKVAEEAIDPNRFPDYGYEPQSDGPELEA